VTDALDPHIRRATIANAPDVARLLHDFNTEFVEALAEER
jgi:hypothetical protein